ncbi:MAG: hypothetical protein L0Z53_13020, partial [Acidobacteriales bacterium]|nr:hypothetical protein [Terriglobales bacterium]
MALMLGCAETQAADAPGLAVTFRGADGKADATTMENVALYVEAGKAATPFVPEGKFTATWEGHLLADLRSEYFFAAALNGSLKLEINGTTVLDGAGPQLALSKAV